MSRTPIVDVANILVTRTGNLNSARLLSLDGGGIRGLSSLFILKEIMKEVRDVERGKGRQMDYLPKPCRYFDMIGGTSAGGIIALMLGRLEMDVDEAIERYGDFLKEVFGKKKWWLSDGKYMATRLKETINRAVLNYNSDPNTPLSRTGPGCKTFVCTRNANQNSLVLMCSYPSAQNPHPTSNGINRHYHTSTLKIWEAALATSAAPTFFKPISIDKTLYVDGGLGYNNPAFEVLDEGEDSFGFAIPDRTENLACLVSIGTGEATTVPAYNWKRSALQRIIPTHAIDTMISIVTDCETTHERLTRRFRNCPGKYFRFNVHKGLGSVKLDDWEKAEYVERMTKEYLAAKADSES